MNRAFIFPGQGSQMIGMCKDLYNSFFAFKELIQEVDDALDYNLSKIIFEGPEEELNNTENTQPALMAVSCGIVKIITSESKMEIQDITSFLSGHSLGQYSAMQVGGCFDISTCAKILNLRGKFMQEASPIGFGSMAAVLGQDRELIGSIIKDASKIGACQIANDNSLSQIVISGETKAVDYAIEKLKENRIKAIKLKVSAAFHSELMIPAQMQMQKIFDQTIFKDSKVDIIDNVSLEITKDGLLLEKKLLEQIPGTIRWRETMEILSNNKAEIYEIGPGKVLTNLMKRSHENIECHNISSPQDIETLLNKL